ncbi:hypothetical protein ACLQ2Q_11540 [Microbacterium sp. DT81.1]|uniref:hypothetical protein n=1 Tax=Microbacterium sp. DT81.1 TaxID=3393413 RepID=UPI003CF9B6BE
MTDTTDGKIVKQQQAQDEQPDFITAALKTHRYLRLSLVFAVAALFIGVIIASVAGGYVKGSISYYYWTPARNVFVGVLIAASLAMLALNGRGGAAKIPLGKRTLKLPSPSMLLDFAAIFGPLIALVPTDVKATEQGLTTFTCEGEEQSCLPKAAFPEVQNAVLTYILTLVVIVVVMLIVQRNEKRQRFALLVPVTAAVTAVALFLFTFVWDEAFPYFRVGPWSFSIHYIATFLFFGAFATVVWIRGTRTDDPEDRTPPSDTQRLWYKILAIAMAADILFLIVLGVMAQFGTEDAIPGFPEVLFGEAVGLTLFAIFWAMQTRQRWNERITILPKKGTAAARVLSRDLTPAA